MLKNSNLFPFDCEPEGCLGVALPSSIFNMHSFWPLAREGLGTALSLVALFGSLDLAFSNIAFRGFLSIGIIFFNCLVASSVFYAGHFIFSTTVHLNYIMDSNGL